MVFLGFPSASPGFGRNFLSRFLIRLLPIEKTCRLTSVSMFWMTEMRLLKREKLVHA